MKVGDLVKWRIGKDYPYELGVVTKVFPMEAMVWFFEDHAHSIIVVRGLELM